LRIFVADGDPDGLRTVERSNWAGKAVVFPRALYLKIRNREKFQLPGVYLLLGPQDNGYAEMLYLGFPFDFPIPTRSIDRTAFLRKGLADSAHLAAMYPVTGVSFFALIRSRVRGQFMD
jgi:hypothetical protein